MLNYCQLVTNIKQQKVDLEVEQFLQEMRDEAFVEIRLDS